MMLEKWGSIESYLDNAGFGVDKRRHLQAVYGIRTTSIIDNT
jgi:hypothetical protein